MTSTRRSWRSWASITSSSLIPTTAARSAPPSMAAKWFAKRSPDRSRHFEIRSLARPEAAGEDQAGWNARRRAANHERAVARFRKRYIFQRDHASVHRSTRVAREGKAVGHERSADRPEVTAHRDCERRGQQERS